MSSFHFYHWLTLIRELKPASGLTRQRAKPIGLNAFIRPREKLIMYVVGKPVRSLLIPRKRMNQKRMAGLLTCPLIGQPSHSSSRKNSGISNAVRITGLTVAGLFRIFT